MPQFNDTQSFNKSYLLSDIQIVTVWLFSVSRLLKTKKNSGEKVQDVQREMLLVKDVSSEWRGFWNCLYI